MATEFVSCQNGYIWYISKVKILYHPEDLEAVIPSDYSRITYTDDGEYLVYGSPFDIWSKQALFVLDKNFNLKFGKVYNIGNGTSFSLKAIKLDNNYYMASLVNRGLGKFSYGLIKTDKDGNEIWNKLFKRFNKKDLCFNLMTFKKNEIIMLGSKEKNYQFGMTLTFLDIQELSKRKYILLKRISQHLILIHWKTVILFLSHKGILTRRKFILLHPEYIELIPQVKPFGRYGIRI